MLLPLSLWAWERRLYWLTAAALASIPLSGQVHLALGALPFVFAYALVRGGDRRWAAGALAAGLAAGVLVWAVSIRGSIGSSRSFAQVERYSAELGDFVSRDPRHGLEAFVFVGWTDPATEPQFLQHVAEEPAVLECHHVTGSWNYILKVRLRCSRISIGPTSADDTTTG